MDKTGEKQTHGEQRSINRVSSAVWPASIRQIVATGKAAQRRRDWLTQRRWLVLLADALSRRSLSLLITLLVVAASLLVALLGLAFWYLLLLPLVLFTLMLLLPTFLASRGLPEAPPPSLTSFAQEYKSSSGLLAFPTQKLRSFSGYFQALPHSSTSHPPEIETPATPMPTEAPQVRVLETYDLRETRVRLLFEDLLRGETGEQTVIRPLSKDFWHTSTSTSSAGTVSLDGPDQLPDQP